MTIIISLYFPILLSPSLSLVLLTMMNLFKKSIHSFLGFTLHTSYTTTPTGDNKLQLQSRHHPTSGLGLITATGGVDRPPNVLESAMLKPNGNPPPPPSPSSKRDAGGIGFIDDIGGGVDGLMSCTESIGFESSDERRVDDQIDEIQNKNDNGGNGNDDNMVLDIDDDDEIWRRRMMRAEGRGNWRKRSFPPPLSSLNWNGKPSFFLRPVRKDGRLELTEVRIHRPEILHASRHDGRLTLHLIPDQSMLEEEEEEEEEEELVEEEEDELVQEEEEAAHAELEEEIMVDEEEDEGEVVEEIRCGKEQEERVGEWRLPMGGNEGFRRCHEMVNQHHHVHGSHHHHHHLRMCGVSIV